MIQMQELFRFEQQGRDPDGRVPGRFAGCDTVEVFCAWPAGCSPCSSPRHARRPRLMPPENCPVPLGCPPSPLPYSMPASSTTRPATFSCKPNAGRARMPASP